MRYIIQSTITKISSTKSVEIKGCEGFSFKKEGKDMNLLLECDDNKCVKEDGNFCLRKQCDDYSFKNELVDFLRDAACNNKKVELEIEDDIINSVSILA